MESGWLVWELCDTAFRAAQLSFEVLHQRGPHRPIAWTLQQACHFESCRAGASFGAGGTSTLHNTSTIRVRFSGEGSVFWFCRSSWCFTMWYQQDLWKKVQHDWECLNPCRTCICMIQYNWCCKTLTTSCLADFMRMGRGTYKMTNEALYGYASQTHLSWPGIHLSTNHQQRLHVQVQEGETVPWEERKMLSKSERISMK